ncbi:MAG: FliA/WhiG family RNA polymerase sigma factor [Fibrobacteres bacterium]|nr:FliA/WhiG family RNA polymerase sigma factor [Fibrobacterota bacterium]
MAQIAELWKEWKVEGSRQAKDKLLAEYAGLLRQTAQRVAVGLPSHVEIGDLVGAGVMGLIRAVETFDPEREIKFETYAVHKIRGAILDDLRAMDWVPRSVRQKGRNLQKAYAELSAQLGRMPYDDETAEHLGLTLVEFEELLTEVAPLTVLSLDEQDGLGDEAPKLSEVIADPQAANALEEMQEGEVRAILREAITGLPAKERAVVAMYHFEELNFKEIGKVLGVTESRVCQIHSKAMIKLRSRVRMQVRK